MLARIMAALLLSIMCAQIGNVMAQSQQVDYGNTHAAASSFCESEGRRLCSLREICPNGTSSAPEGGALPGANWAPYAPGSEYVPAGARAAYVNVGAHAAHMCEDYTAFVERSLGGHSARPDLLDPSGNVIFGLSPDANPWESVVYCCGPEACDGRPHSAHCNGHGSCAAGSCTCSSNYDGAGCDSCAFGFAEYPSCVQDPCQPDPCNGHGSCSNSTLSNQTYQCSCDVGFTGVACEGCDSGFISYSPPGYSPPPLFAEAGLGQCPSGQRVLTTADECAAAAVALNLRDTTVSSVLSETTTTAANTYPLGCYYKLSTDALYFNAFGDPASTDTDRVSLCAAVFTFQFQNVGGGVSCVDDLCDPDPCSGHGNCTGGGCACDVGYAGGACDSCDPRYTGTTCDRCATGYSGYPSCCTPGMHSELYSTIEHDMGHDFGILGFNDMGDQNSCPSHTYANGFPNGGGVSVAMEGWSHTRAYAHG